MRSDPLRHVDGVGTDVDLEQPTGSDRALHDADLLGGEFGPAEIPVLALMHVRLSIPHIF